MAILIDKKRISLLLFFVCLWSLSFGQSWNNTGNALQRQVGGSYINYRFNLGSVTPAFLPFYSKAQADSASTSIGTGYAKLVGGNTFTGGYNNFTAVGANDWAVKFFRFGTTTQIGGFLQNSNGSGRMAIYDQSGNLTVDLNGSSSLGSVFTNGINVGGINIPTFTINGGIVTADGSGHFQQSATRISDLAPSTGSANYIQNGTFPQTANFNITGSGTVGDVLTAPSFQGVNTILSGAAYAPLFAVSPTGPSGNKVQIMTNTLTSTRDQRLQDKDGDIALLSDITGSISGIANYIPIFTGANTIGNSPIYVTSGFVGIGTTTPTEKLDVTGNINVSGTGFFSGNVGIGTLLSASTNFNISRPLTGAMSVNGIRLNGVIQHDATATTNFFQALISTEAASFTASVINGLNISFPTLGAGSSVTELNGINIGSNLTVATNNYGIRSQIPSGIGRWNVYMNGTAQNAMVGLTKFGSTAVPVYNVDIAGTLGATGNVTFSVLSTVGVVHNSAAGLLSTSLIATGDITNNAVTLGKIQNLSTTGRLLGSGSAGASVQEITLGPGLSMSGTTLNYDGSSSAPVVLSSTTGINAKTTGTVALYTVPTGKTLVVTGYVVRCTAATAITNGPSLDIGDSITGVASIVSNQALNALTTTITDFVFNITGMSHTVVASGIVNVNLNTASTGTSQTISIDLLGYLK